MPGTVIGLVVILAPLALYLVSAFGIPRGKFAHPDDFFVAFRRFGATPFSNSAIAYAFQVATVYPFLAWGASGQILAPLVNTLFWGLGILVFRRIFSRLTPFLGKGSTLHGFLGTTYSSPPMRLLTSLLTITGLLGVALGETYWGSQVLVTLLPVKGAVYVAMFLMTYFVLVYISYGGQLSSIRTDQVQIAVSYLGVFGVLAYLTHLLFASRVALDARATSALLLLVASVPVVLLIRRGRFFSPSSEHRGTTIWTRLVSAVVVAMLVLVMSVACYVLATRPTSFGIPRLLSANAAEFGLMGLISLALLPLLWQFVDMTNWQRILCLELPNHDNADSAIASSKRGLAIYAFESPFTWVLFISMGVLIALVMPSATAGEILFSFPELLLKSASLIDKTMGYVFIASVLAIMLSTVDSVLMAMIFTFVYDVLPNTRRVLDTGDQEAAIGVCKKAIGIGNLFGALLVTAVIAAFVLIDVKLKKSAEFIGLLVAFYTTQLAFFPSVLGAVLLNNRPSRGWALASILLGAAAGLPLGLYATFLRPEWQWYPVISTVVTSGVIYLFGVLSRRRQ